jgi:hypothetical protein
MPSSGQHNLCTIVLLEALKKLVADSVLNILQDLREMFSAYGTVQECRILHRGEDIRGAGALVRMNNVAAASQAILALNGYLPRSQIGDFSSMPLLVRYADSPEEKARKQARKDQLAGRQHRSVLLCGCTSDIWAEYPGGVSHSFLSPTK